MKKAPARRARSIKLSVSKLSISWHSSSYFTSALRSLSEVRSMLSVSVILAQKNSGWVVTFMLDIRDGGPTTGYISSGFFGGMFPSPSLVSIFLLTCKRFDAWSCTPALGQQKGALPYTHTILNQLTGFLIARRETGTCFICITRDWVRISIHSQLSSSIWANSDKDCSSSYGSCLL